MTMTNTIVAQILNDYFSSQTLWLALHTSDPTNAGLANSELTSSNYQRQQITWELPSNRGVANSDDITFPALPPVTIPYLGVWTTATSGSLLAVLNADPAYKTVSNGSSLYIAARSIFVEVE